MANQIAPSALYMQLQYQLDEVHELVRKIADVAAEYRSYEPESLTADELGPPVSGPEVQGAVLRGLELVEHAFGMVDSAYRGALSDASRLCLKD
jgi:hypothetical protein